MRKSRSLYFFDYHKLLPIPGKLMVTMYKSECAQYNSNYKFGNYMWTEQCLIYFYFNSFKSLIVQYMHCSFTVSAPRRQLALSNLLWQVAQLINTLNFFIFKLARGASFLNLFCFSFLFQIYTCTWHIHHLFQSNWKITYRWICKWRESRITTVSLSLLPQDLSQTLHPIIAICLRSRAPFCGLYVRMVSSLPLLCSSSGESCIWGVFLCLLSPLLSE